MRTDDFNGPKSEDTFDERPDVQDQLHESERADPDDFNEFDAAPVPGTQGNSLGEMVRNNPIIKIAGVIGVLLLVVFGLVMFGGSDDDTRQSSVGQAVQENEAPGSETSEAYRDAINEENQQRLEHAVQTGQSTMPIPTNTSQNGFANGVAGEPPLTLNDPLADFRNGNQQPLPEPTLTPSSPRLQPEAVQQQMQQRTPQGPSAEAVNALSTAMGAQMQNILDKHKINGAQVMQVTAADFYTKNAGVGGTGVAGSGVAGSNYGFAPEAPIVQEILIPAGTIVYAQTLTESNTDAPGPVLARLSSGPLSGARVLGTFDNTDNFLTLQFNTIVFNGISYPTNAVAIDPKSTLPAVATDIDRRYWRRVILPAAARFIEGMGNAIAQREQTVTVNNGTTVSSQGDLKTNQELAAGLASGTQELAEELDREADRTRVMIKVRAGTPIGILFLDPVTKEVDSQ